VGENVRIARVLPLLVEDTVLYRRAAL